MIKAWAARAAGAELRPFEYDPGALGADQVEIAVDYCGICHSDLSMLDNEWGMTAYPFVPGHEVAGRVVAVGEAVGRFKVGDAVGLGWHSAYCNHCGCCMSGDHNLCNQAEGTIVGRHGGFAERVRAQASSVVALPEGLPAEVAGPLFCGGVTVFNPILQYELSPTARVAVIGIGGLGHMALQFLNAWGCHVTAFTSSPDKQQEALALGAHATLDSRNKDALKAATASFDLILSTVNVGLEWGRYINCLKPKGRLHFVGAVMEPVQVSVFSLMMGQRSVSASPVGSPITIATMLEFAVRHGIQPRIELFDMKDVNKALEHLRNGSPRYRIVLKNNGW